ncbi:MAG: hypothetical protein BAJALOKI2v1_900005 [Promethearchaeota archaeon]|nr:MAG: hypothetical protein BAJALOKI2v1_900005 [Candidatus Lokiarchaeota archaeon]
MGGFGLTSLRLIKDTSIECRIRKILDFYNFEIIKGGIIKLDSRSFGYLKFGKKDILRLTEGILKSFNLKQG